MTPSAPSTPANLSWTLSGSLSETDSGARIPGATLAFEGRPEIATDGNGNWSLAGTGAVTPSRLNATISGSGFVTRTTHVLWNSLGRADIALDLIADRPPFSTEFFRQLVRDSLDNPDALSPLRRWFANPNFYINVTNPATGQALKPEEVDTIVRGIRETVPQMTGGLFSAGTIDTGETARDAQFGVINVIIVSEPDSDFCGRAFVGSNPGRITLNYGRCRNSCGSDQIGLAVVAHEVGHALGFYHVPQGMMRGTIGQCATTTFTEPERFHATLAYKRPAGNADPDNDPGSFAAATAGTAGPEVSCPLDRPRR